LIYQNELKCSHELELLLYLQSRLNNRWWYHCTFAMFCADYNFTIWEIAFEKRIFTHVLSPPIIRNSLYVRYWLFYLIYTYTCAQEMSHERQRDSAVIERTIRQALCRLHYERASIVSFRCIYVSWNKARQTAKHVARR